MFASIAIALTAAAIQSADSTRYIVLNHGRSAGEMVVARTADSVVVRYQHTDRNRGQRQETRYWFDGDVLRALAVRPLNPDGVPGNVSDRFERDRDSARWTRGETRGAVPLREPALYRPGATTPFDHALLARFLLAQPERSGRLWPGGRARLQIVADTVVPTDHGPERVRFVMIRSGDIAGTGVWLDARGELFASEAAWFITVRPGAEQALPLLRAVELRHREAEAAALAQRLAPARASAIVIRNGDVFDSERGVVRPRTTVLIRGDRIAAVGPADSIAVPSGATVVDATGKTVIPGMWDMHSHFLAISQNGPAVQQLAHGITTIRDMAADLDVAVSHRDRANAGSIVSPRVILAGFMEGPGAWAGPSEVLVHTEADARAWVERYHMLGFRQIKLYNLTHPDLVPAIADEAHRRRMRLSGHVPRGLSLQAAVNLGFDEINHAAFLFSTFFPDSLFTPTMRAYSAVAAAVAPRFDVDSPEMTALIDLLRKRGTVIDGTFNLWMNRRVLNGESDAGTERYVRLLKRLFDAGVTIVPGTDNLNGSTFVNELEWYEHAGIPAPDVLRIATLIPARVMGDDADYGSIAAGKVADLVIIDGRPHERIADLRRVHRVVRAGRVFDPKQLRQALVLQ